LDVTGISWPSAIVRTLQYLKGGSIRMMPDTLKHKIVLQKQIFRAFSVVVTRKTPITVRQLPLREAVV
jgi:hypothetical protein